MAVALLRVLLQAGGAVNPYAALAMNLAAKAAFCLPQRVALFALDRLAASLFGPLDEPIEVVGLNGERITL